MERDSRPTLAGLRRPSRSCGKTRTWQFRSSHLHWTDLPDTEGKLALRSAQAGERDLMTTSAARLAGIEAPDEPLPVFRLLRTVVDNPIKAWPRALYRERLYRSRVVGRDTVYVMSPDLIRAVLRDDADNFEKGEIARRALGALGDAILTADGSRWRVATSRCRSKLSSGADSSLLACDDRRRGTHPRSMVCSSLRG
jgi:hypothetical protein